MTSRPLEGAQVAESNLPGVIQPVDDVYCWVEQGSSVMLKAVTRFGDPVELTGASARTIAAALLDLADRLDQQ